MQAEGVAIPKAVVMETTTGEATTTKPVVAPTTSTVSRPATLTAIGPASSIAPKTSTEAQVDTQPEAGTLRLSSVR